MKAYIEERLLELKAIHKQIIDEHNLHRQLFEQNSDSISLRDKVRADENSGYICEIWGRINELELLKDKYE